MFVIRPNIMFIELCLIIYYSAIYILCHGYLQFTIIEEQLTMVLVLCIVALYDYTHIYYFYIMPVFAFDILHFYNNNKSFI